MNLLIDSGNSFIKWALAGKNSLSMESRCPTSAVAGLYKKWAGSAAPERVIVSNVAGESVAIVIRETVKTLWQIDTEFVVSSQSCCGLTNSYHKPEQLGVDRWMAMLAAYKVTKGPLIVVDCGTAVTIDLVNKGGVFVGGAIMPGMNTALHSLRAGTAAVNEMSSLNDHTNSVAQSTEDAVAAGVLLGLAGGIEKVVREQSAMIDGAPAIFITGGDAEKLMKNLDITVTFSPDLVLQGLRVVAVDNKV